MEIQFSRAGQPDGGKIRNFLLEKVCVVMLFTMTRAQGQAFPCKGIVKGSLLILLGGV